MAEKVKLKKLTKEDQRILHRDPLTLDWLLYEVLGPKPNYKRAKDCGLDLRHEGNHTRRYSCYDAGLALDKLITEHRRRLLEKQVCDGEFFL